MDRSGCRPDGRLARCRRPVTLSLLRRCGLRDVLHPRDVRGFLPDPGLHRLHAGAVLSPGRLSAAVQSVHASRRESPVSRRVCVHGRQSGRRGGRRPVFLRPGLPGHAIAGGAHRQPAAPCPRLVSGGGRPPLQARERSRPVWRAGPARSRCPAGKAHAHPAARPSWFTTGNPGTAASRFSKVRSSTPCSATALPF